MYIISDLMVIKMEKREPLMEVKEKNTAIIIKDFSKDGVKMQVNLSGEVKGKYNANHVETSENLLKMDGTMEWEARAMETTDDGDVIFDRQWHWTTTEGMK